MVDIQSNDWIGESEEKASFFFEYLPSENLKNATILLDDVAIFHCSLFFLHFFPAGNIKKPTKVQACCCPSSGKNGNGIRSSFLKTFR